MPSKNKSELEQWASIVRAKNPDELPAANMPLHVLCGEAVDVAKFFEKYWAPQVDEKRTVIRPGLESAVPKGKKQGAGRLSAKTGAEILSLQRATQAAQTQYLLTVDKVESPKARAELVLGEIQAVLQWYFDDGIQDEKDEMLAKLDAAHADDPGTNDALASALDDYAHLAVRYRDDLDGLGGFEAAVLDEAGELAAALRSRSAQPEVVSGKARDAIALRNKLAGYLLEQMGLVRSAARFVFRKQPEIAREATSAYERRKRAATRKSKDAPSKASSALATPSAPATPPTG